MNPPLRTEIPLQRRKVLKKTFNSLVKIIAGWAVLSVVFYTWIGQESGKLPPWAANKVLLWIGWIAILALIIFFRMIYQILYFVTYYYDMDENNVMIRKGVLTKREITLPFAKITDVYVDQDIADVALGLYDVHISTPTVESGRFAHIDGLNKSGSAKLKKLILDAVNKASAKQ